MRILVCGGAGYIGAHMLKRLHAAGHEVVSFDNLSTGNRHAVRWGELVEGDLLDPGALRDLFHRHRFDVVMHFSARSLVAESLREPALYYQNNVIGTFYLLEAMREAGVRNLIFSSSAAVFGNPLTERIGEDHPRVPITPYGQSKLMVEQMLKGYAVAYGLNSVSLRYFNAAGADPEGELGEEHDPETHLIPNIFKMACGGTGEVLSIFGGDYPTPDGTCIRDYVHVRDLCEAHLRAIAYLEREPGAHAFNLGNGNGWSVLQVLAVAEAVVGRRIPYRMVERRAGDPAMLIVNSARARDELGWVSRHTDLRYIIETAWQWERGARTAHREGRIAGVECG
ncbi:MAG: UDP-glucose 4-epimerase GalE [Candidatus Sedimenticola endophacoides]|uniref:UDP-glucose 4-epimerase n=1 Tax=Candidatus Sedimenticola endophacoides TaxID=2548426 RepID=A0A657Q126_9GAMM|nr:MAG: UDP-glucose 4-epimerase GalE [Candidatus Sedimenticola endophacoides]OQX33195.1 MAG: UDP-glucose 4-epimerase GalE [Candidatus Sedimenticola endophacoides]OQX41993.1 MAG: UDP-glucose 4-epimerase GalE [Candidatus Sedimenticola endophacoides]OQX46717.1 MAG: UDP-glucose 4-epimerase GalE [Candidatus Sedimenticola endophacoides]OQX47986.1 MAG: UDP-glucose 4-epimerase GalE [Candidatus Sedimenticola endophacoides]